MKSNPEGTQVIARCATLLRLIGNANQQGARLVDLEKLAALSHSTAMRILAGLEAEDLVRRAEPGKRYMLGPLVYELGLEAQRFYQTSTPALKRLAKLALDIGDTVYLVRRSGDDSVCVALLEGGYAVQVKTVEVGTRRPMGASAGGIANLLALPAQERRAILSRNRQQLLPYEKLYGRTTAEAVRDALTRGYVYMPTHIAPHVSAIALPIPGGSGYALSTSALEFRHANEKQRAAIVARMEEVSEAIKKDVPRVWTEER